MNTDKKGTRMKRILRICTDKIDRGKKQKAKNKKAKSRS